jgi:tagatose-1,6-bisphosphate aldolase
LFILPPTDSLTAATITAQLDTPWVMTARGLTYEKYKEQLKICLESGAVGFLAGSVLWADFLVSIPDFADVASRLQLFKTRVRDRFLELSRLVGS